MAKDNLFLGMARGSVGDVTFSRLNGVQVARARNRAPHNPQSPAQMVQRIIMSTVGKAYSFMQEICNHSFEGFETGQLSQRKFMEVNIGLMRDKAADVLAYPVEEVVKSSEAYNFSYKNDYAPVINRYMISGGSLPSLQLSVVDNVVYPVIDFDPGDLTTNTMTYQNLVDALSVERGDQLTFIQVTHNDSLTGHDRDILTGFRYARVILEPANGDMSTIFIGTNGTINSPNERNVGVITAIDVRKSEDKGNGLHFNLQNVSSSLGSDKKLAGSAVILSRYSAGAWRRSQQFLEVRSLSGSYELNSSVLGEAYESYLIGASSDLYLNQAE